MTRLATAPSTEAGRCSIGCGGCHIHRRGDVCGPRPRAARSREVIYALLQCGSADAGSSSGAVATHAPVLPGAIDAPRILKEHDGETAVGMLLWSSLPAGWLFPALYLGNVSWRPTRMPSPTPWRPPPPATCPKAKTSSRLRIALTLVPFHVVHQGVAGKRRQPWCRPPPLFLFILAVKWPVPLADTGPLATPRHPGSKRPPKRLLPLRSS